MSSSIALADVGSISVSPLDNDHAKINVSLSGYWVSTQNSPNYSVCWKKQNAFQNICSAHTPVLVDGDLPYIELPSANSGWTLTIGTTYKIKVSCYCAKDNNSYFSWRTVATTDYVHAAPPPTLVSSRRVRLRNVSTGQCIWIESSTLRVRHWGCWNAANMTFNVETYSNGWAYLRHEQSSLCIWGKNPSLPSVGPKNCGTIGTLFQINEIDAVTHNVQLNIPFTEDIGPFTGIGPGGCLYTSAQNGDDVLKQKPCTSDAKFSFHLDPV